MTESTMAMLVMAVTVILPMIPAFFLFRYLPSTGDASGPLHGLQVKFGGAFAGYVVIFLVLIYVRPTDTEHYHTWTVAGTVAVQPAPGEADPNLNDIVIRVVPPRLGVMNGGILALDISVKEDAAGRLHFPDLQFDLAGYRGATVPLRKDRPYGSLQADVVYDDASRTVLLKSPVLLQSAKSGQVYSASTAAVPVIVQDTPVVAVTP